MGGGGKLYVEGVWECMCSRSLGVYAAVMLMLLVAVECRAFEFRE